MQGVSNDSLSGGRQVTEREEMCLPTSASGEHAADPGDWGEKDLGIMKSRVLLLVWNQALYSWLETVIET